MVYCAEAGWPQKGSVVVTLFIQGGTILCPESGTLASFIALPVGRIDAAPDYSPLLLVEPWITAAYF